MLETAAKPITNYTVSLTTNSASQSLGTGYSLVRLVATSDCFVLFQVGSAPTATTANGLFLPANAPEYFNINGDLSTGLYVAGILASGTGSLYVSLMG